MVAFDGSRTIAVQLISYDRAGNSLSGSRIDYLVPIGSRHRTRRRTSPSPLPNHAFRAEVVGASATFGAPSVIANAVVDELWHLGVGHIDIPGTSSVALKALRDHRLTGL